MIHRYNKYKSRITYELDKQGVLIIKEGVVERLHKVDLVNEKYTYGDGVLFLGGIQFLIYAFVALGISIPPLMQNEHASMNMWLFLGVPFAVFAVAVGVIWARWGLLARGCRLMFSNGEKLYIYMGDDDKSYIELLEEIKMISKNKTRELG